MARYDGSIAGFWSLSSDDQFFVGDFNGDGKDDLFVSNGTNELGLLASDGTSLAGTVRYSGSLPGWSLRSGDQYFVGDFDADGRSDLYVFNGTDWGSTKYLAMLKSSGAGLSGISLFTDALPNWSLGAGDQFYVGDFNGDGRADLYVFNGTDWSEVYLLMAQSTGTGLSFVRRYDGGSADAAIPGWSMTHGDRLFIADANKDGKVDLFVYNPAIDWSTEYLGALISSGSALSGSWSEDWVGGWNLGPADEILVVNYEGGPGKADIFIRNQEWFGLLRQVSSGLGMDRIYYHWIYTALYDATPWSDSMLDF